MNDFFRNLLFFAGIGLIVYGISTFEMPNVEEMKMLEGAFKQSFEVVAPVVFFFIAISMITVIPRLLKIFTRGMD